MSGKKRERRQASGREEAASPMRVARSEDLSAALPRVIPIAKGSGRSIVYLRVKKTRERGTLLGGKRRCDWTWQLFFFPSEFHNGVSENLVVPLRERFTSENSWRSKTRNGVERCFSRRRRRRRRRCGIVVASSPCCCFFRRNHSPAPPRRGTGGPEQPRLWDRSSLRRSGARSGRWERIRRALVRGDNDLSFSFCFQRDCARAF